MQRFVLLAKFFNKERDLEERNGIMSIIANALTTI